MVMKEDIVDFETAKLANELGFDENTRAKYTIAEISNEFQSKVATFGERELIENSYVLEEKNDEFTIPAPTQSFLRKWLRLEHDIDVVLSKGFEHQPGDYYRYSGYEAIVSKTHKRHKTYSESESIMGWDYTSYCKTPEEAFEKGLQLALKRIQENHE